MILNLFSPSLDSVDVTQSSTESSEVPYDFDLTSNEIYNSDAYNAGQQLLTSTNGIIIFIAFLSVL